MDTPSHFFVDCLDFEDPNSYQSPEHDVGGGGCGGGLHSFQPYGGKLDVCDSPISADGRTIGARAGVWEGFDEHIGAMVADHKPLFVDPGLYDGDNDCDEMKAQVHELSDNPSRPSTRRTSSSKSGSQGTSKSESTSTDITPPDQDNPNKKRKIRKASSDSNPEEVEDDQKRSKFLERNRIAASKCREKKKQYVSELEEAKIGLESQHARLQMEYNGLLGEVSGLKHHLMAHAKCNDPNINRWLDNEARRFVQTTNELFGQPFAQDYGPPGQAGLPASPPHSRNASIASTYQALQGVQLDGLGSSERQGGAYSHGSPLFPSPTDRAFQSLTSPRMKREPGINYDHMPDAMFASEQSTFGGA
ncbi:hypothetical protein B0T22DRAFT_443097 [Podospora appendiculata]|uniref:BZIP domain-containing protein n=1 Tax=Podospora appendiculata TaxID=314037 RepID=A0AAE1CAX9_9PEZI|nr:hypothetical protein B0T22DRAFT_443097 [Podospora appendiculata]